MFTNLYKQNINKDERQELRRKQLLQQQKLKRLEQQDQYRHHGEPHFHEIKENRKSFQKKFKHTNIENINLQLSEWFKEKPENLDDWFLVPCPMGQRCLVVCENGKTKMFSKNNRYRMTFLSLLPGGGLNGSDNDHSILDCIYNKEKDTFYVLDALHFFIPLRDCDTEFRFFWLKSKFVELDEIKEKFKNEEMKSFQLLEYCEMSNKERLAMALQRYPLWIDNQPQLDGFLFYHKMSHYECGTTPLVCWLFPFMVPDILHMAVCHAYQTPTNYCKQNPWKYMNEFDKEMMQKKNKKINLAEYNLDLTAMEEDQELEEEHIDECIGDKDNFLESLLTAEKLLELE